MNSGAFEQLQATAAAWGRGDTTPLVAEPPKSKYWRGRDDLLRLVVERAKERLAERSNTAPLNG